MIMKTFAYKLNICRCAATIGLATILAFSSACGNNAKADGDISAHDMETERPDSQLSDLMRSLADGDASGFAALCTYPIQRIYPLRCIEDSSSMVDYFPIMVDDSLRKIAKSSSPKDWLNYGWRGWALGDSTILWFDDGLQFVDYESKAETGLRKMLAKNEIMTLSPELREGWIPVETLVETDGNRVFRIDTNDDVFRLLEYEKEGDLRGNPVLMLIGSMSTEGSAGYRVFVFSDSVGKTKAEYLPDSEPPVKIDITTPDKKLKSHHVRRGYWRDLVK